MTGCIDHLKSHYRTEMITCPYAMQQSPLPPSAIHYTDVYKLKIITWRGGQGLVLAGQTSNAIENFTRVYVCDVPFQVLGDWNVLDSVAFAF